MMTMVWPPLSRLLRPKPRYRILQEPVHPRIFLLEHCIEGIIQCISPEMQRGHEGVVYLYGQTDGTDTLIAGVIRPEAATSWGSFEVSSLAMARVVNAVCALGLKVVGQLHTHPTLAEHSQGDEDGARIAYQGFTSIVLPDYGRHLPSLEGMAAYMFRDGRFQELPTAKVYVTPGVLP